MKNDLIERYIYAVTRRMPGKQREDVSQELRGLIEDMLMERCGARKPEEKDIRIILMELGTPRELYAQYDPDAEKYLIGQPYFSAYKMVMSVVWMSVAVGMGVSSLILLTMGQWSPMEAVGNFFANTIQGLASAFTIVTLLFVWLERKGVSLDSSLDDLPPVPKKTKEISKWESVVGITFCVLFMVVFLFVPEILGVVIEEDGYLPLFDVVSIRANWYYILAFGLLGIAGESIKLLERRYNKKVLTVTIVTNMLSGAVAILWLTGGNRLNEEYYRYIQNLFTDNDFLASLFSSFHLFFLGILLFALAMDTAEAAYRTIKE